MKTLTKHISYKCKCRFDGRKCNSNQKWNKDKYWCEYKKHCICEKIIFGILLHVVKYLASIIDDSVIMCDEIVDLEEAKTVTTKFN